MEKSYKVATCHNEKILAAARALSAVGLGAWADVYYVDPESKTPYFKLTKPYDKRNYDEPDTVSLMLSVEDELDCEDYCVHAIFGCAWFRDASAAAKLVKGLWDGSLCEVTEITKGVSIVAFVKNLGSPKLSLAPLTEHADELAQMIEEYLAADEQEEYLAADEQQCYFAFAPAAPYDLQISDNRWHPSFALHPTYFFCIPFGAHIDIILPRDLED